MEPLGAAASALTLAELLKETIKVIVKYKRALKEAPTTVVSLNDEIDAIDAVLQDFGRIQNDLPRQAAISDSALSRLLRNSNVLEIPSRKLERVQAKVSKLNNLESIKRKLLFPFQQDRIRDDLELVRHNVALIETALHLENNTNIGRTQSEIALLRQKLAQDFAQITQLLHGKQENEKNQRRREDDRRTGDSIRSGVVQESVFNDRIDDPNAKVTSTLQGLDYKATQISRWYPFDKPEHRTQSTASREVKKYNLAIGCLVLAASVHDTASMINDCSLRSESHCWSAGFVPACWFLQTMIRIRLEWTICCTNLYGIKVNPEFIDVVPDDHPMILSAASGDLETLKVLLLAEGAPRTSCSTRAGWTPLHFAAAAGQDHVCRFLLQNGSPVNRAGLQSIEPLHVAAHFGQLQVFRTLLSAGGELHNVHDHGMNAIMELLVASRHFQLHGFDAFLDWLVRGQDRHLVDIEAQDNEGHSILFYLTGMSAPQAIVLLSDDYEEEIVEQVETDLSLHIHAFGIKKLIGMGVKLDTPDIYGNTLLHAATRNERQDILRELLLNKCDIDARDAEDYTALHHAVMQGHYEIVTMLLEAGADVKAEAYPENHMPYCHDDLWHVTALSVNAAEGSVDIFNILQSYGACKEVDNLLEVLKISLWCNSINVAKGLLKAVDSTEGLSGILYAANSNAMIDLLVNAGADPDGDDNRPWRPLLWATCNANTARVEHLLKLGANANITDHNSTGESQRWTALHYAAENGDESSVRVLLFNGADPKLRDTHQFLPEDLAKRSGYDRVADLIRRWNCHDQAGQHTSFVEEDPSLDLITVDSTTCDLTRACQINDLTLVQQLVRAGRADLNSCHSSIENCPLGLAIVWQNYEMAEFLLHAGADFQSQGERSPTREAANRGHAGLLELMIQKGARVNEKFKGNDTLLLRCLDSFWAHGNTRSMCSEVVRVLVKAGADVNVVDDFGRTPLDKAVQRGALEAARLLVDAGADLDQPSSRNVSEPPRESNVYAMGIRTPLAWAAFCGHGDIVKLLYKAGAKWKTLRKDPAVTHIHGYLMQSWFLDSVSVAKSAQTRLTVTPEPSGAAGNTQSLNFEGADRTLTNRSESDGLKAHDDAIHDLSSTDVSLHTPVNPITAWLKAIYHYVDKCYQILRTFQFEVLVSFAVVLLLSLRYTYQLFPKLSLAHVKSLIIALLLGSALRLLI